MIYIYQFFRTLKGTALKKVKFLSVTWYKQFSTKGKIKTKPEWRQQRCPEKSEEPPKKQGFKLTVLPLRI